MKKLKNSKQEREFDYSAEVANLTTNIRNIAAEIAEELKLAKDTFTVTLTGHEGNDGTPMFVISAPDIRNSILIKGRCNSYLFSTDDAFKKELMFCLRFALALKEKTTEAGYRTMDYSPLNHAFVCNAYHVGGSRGTYLEVKFDPYGETISGGVEYGYRLPELHPLEYRYKTGSYFGELLPILETDIISQLVGSAESITSIPFNMNIENINCTRKWLSVQLAYGGVCVEACTILLLALEKMDVKSSNIERYRDFTMSPIEQDTQYTSSNRDAIMRFKLAYGDTEVFNVLILQNVPEKQLLLIDGSNNRLVINLNSVYNYHQTIEMVINFIRR